jgi:hypothetical protein
MFLRKLYHANKLLFSLVILFICSQLYINAKVGVVATPLMHYGMYSVRSNLPLTVDVWEVEINGKKIELQKLHPKTVDNILQPLNIFYNLPYDSGIAYQSKRFLTAVFLPFEESNFHSSLTKEQFENSYRKHLNNILKVHVNQVRVYRSTYAINGSKFIEFRKSLFLVCH